MSGRSILFVTLSVATAGAAFGLVDASLARSATLSLAPGAFGVGALLGAGAGAVLGLILGVGLRRGPTSWGLPAVALVALALAGVGLDRGLPGAPAASAPSRPGASIFPAVLWIAVHDLERTRQEGALPALEALAAEGVRFLDVVPAEPARRGGLSALLTGRFPEGRSVAGAPSLAEVVSDVQYSSALVLAGDAAADAPLTAGFGQGLPVAGEGPWDLGPSARHLSLVRAASAVLAEGERAPDVAGVVRAAEAWLEDRRREPWLVVVEVPRGPPAEVDGALASLIATAKASAGDRPLGIVVSSISTAEADAFHVPRAPAVMRLPEGAHAGIVVRNPVSALDLSATVLSWVPASQSVGETLDGVVWGAPQFLKLATEVVYDAEAAAAATAGDAGKACRYIYPSQTPLPVVTGDGAQRVARSGGYALVVAADGARRLVDEVVDPEGLVDLLAEGAVTCEGEPAAARADRLAQGLADRWEGSKARAEAAVRGEAARAAVR